VHGAALRQLAGRPPGAAAPWSRLIACGKQVALLLRSGTNGLARRRHRDLTLRQAWWLTQSIGQNATSARSTRPPSALQGLLAAAVVVQQAGVAGLGARPQVRQQLAAPADVEDAAAIEPGHRGSGNRGAQVGFRRDPGEGQVAQHADQRLQSLILDLEGAHPGAGRRQPALAAALPDAGRRSRRQAARPILVRPDQLVARPLELLLELADPPLVGQGGLLPVAPGAREPAF
jgi:hypothetical protein